MKHLNKEKNRKSLHEKSYEIVNRLFSPSQIKILLGKKKVHDPAKAFAIRYFSKRAYIYLKEKCHFPLPHISTLQRYAAKMDVKQGFLDDVFKINEI